ncbi:MAG: ABC transporter substrate-binding protein, partial [Ardenticatenaceae bacterium]
MARPIRIAVLVVVALLIGACAEPEAETPTETTQAPETTVSPETTAEPAEAGDNVLRLGAALALSGDVSREGNFLRDGYEYWKEHVNARGGVRVGDQQYMVEIIYYDDTSDPETGARLTERLITEDEVDFVLGPFSSGIQINTSVVAERHGVLT